MGIFTKIFIWPFLCIPRVVLFISTYFGHSTTKNSLKYQIWNFAFWVDKMSQNRAIFFEIAHKSNLTNWFQKQNSKNKLSGQLSQNGGPHGSWWSWIFM